MNSSAFAGALNRLGEVAGDKRVSSVMSRGTAPTSGARRGANRFPRNERSKRRYSGRCRGGRPPRLTTK